SIEIGPRVAALAAESGDPSLTSLCADARDRLFLDLGAPLPTARVRENPHLDDDAYTISVAEIPVGSGRIESANLEALAHQLHRVARSHAHEFVGLQETQSMLDQLERTFPAVVRNVVPKPVSLQLLAEVLRRLVEEGVNIRPLRQILEALAGFAPQEKDPLALTELVRAQLRRQITHRHAHGGVLTTFLLSHEIEEAVTDSIQRTATGAYLAMPPDQARDVIEAVKAQIAEDAEGTPPPVLLTQAPIRRFVRRLLEVDLPDLVVLSYQELAPEVTVRPLGRIGVGSMLEGP
ncbi:MAG: FHIPEP family type III secretion protein, partial [Myxococcales bacterium]|nr:FHIPEP family type III secretion protein [Myxococcales bacterium]